MPKPTKKPNPKAQKKDRKKLMKLERERKMQIIYGRGSSKNLSPANKKKLKEMGYILE
jgi:hypothetical protein